MPGDRGSEAAKPELGRNTRVAIRDAFGPAAPKDIGISMRAEILRHKQRDGCRADHRYCFWELGRTVPTAVGKGSRMWVASEGRWRGFFIVHEEPVESELHFWSESWTPRDGGPRSPFQGFTYKVPGAS